MNKIKVCNISKKYCVKDNIIPAVDGVSFEFESGKFYSVVGRSGSGKSTFLGLLGGLQKPDSGEIYFNNNNICMFKAKNLSKYKNENLGFIFQNFCLENRFTCLENVLLPTYVNKKMRKNNRQRASELLEKLGLSKRKNHLVSELSGGEKQRVAIARALINEPDIILADEPTGNLDSNTGEHIIQILHDIASEGKIVIMVTHNMEDAKKTDRILSFRDGRVED
ncbi:MAG: ABC transporter ATP-binding protein [Butyrivibrio sp.]